MNENELTVDGQTYSLGKLGVMEQWHVARRIGPIVGMMGASALQFMKAGTWDENDLAPVLPAMMQMLAQMTDADSDFVIYACLGAVTRQQGERWAPITTGAPPTAKLMFQDIELPSMIRLVLAVIRKNLGSFIPGPSEEKPSPGP